MKRKNLYKRILLKILSAYSGWLPASPDYQDVVDHIDNENMDDAAACLLLAPFIKQALKPLLLTIKDIYNNANKEDDLIPEYSTIELFQPIADKYKRPFFYRGKGLTIITSEYIFPPDPNSRYRDDIWMSLQSIMLDSNQRDTFLNQLYVGVSDGFCIGFKKTALGYSKRYPNNNIKKEDLYAFGLAAFMHSKQKLPVVEELKFDNSQLPFNAFNFNHKIKYQQYYDILDVVNEWLYSSDILTAFMKMYQIVEYMVYRKQMYCIVNSSSLKQSFLRSVKTMNKKFEDNERTSVILGLKALFPGIRPSKAKIKKAQNFIGEFFGRTKNGKPYLSTAITNNEMDEAVARFVYDMRCSIVHNKESELHFTYSNYDMYKCVIPLAREIHDALMVKVWDYLNTESNKIEYKRKQLDLY